MTNIYLLRKAVNDNPSEDVPLRMLIDEYQEHGDWWSAGVLLVELQSRSRCKDKAALREWIDLLLNTGPGALDTILELAGIRQELMEEGSL